MKVKINNRKSFDYIIILIFVIIISFPFLSKNLNIYANEGIYNIARAYESFKNLAANDGRIITGFFNYLATGDNILSSPIPNFALIIGNYIFKSFEFTYKFFSILLILLSGIYMYKYLYKVTQNSDISLLSAIIYMTAPIHLNEIYINNSFASNFVFLFIPMAYLGTYKMLNTTETSHYFAIGVIGLILSDLTLAILVGFTIIIYMFINIKSWNIEHIRKSMTKNIIAIVLITSFFVFPYIQTKLSSNYGENKNSGEEFLNTRIEISKLFVTNDIDANVFELGPHIIIMLSFSIMTLNRLKKNKKEYIFSLILAIAYIFMSTKYFPWGIFHKCVFNIEKAYKFLIVAVFFECIVCAINMNVVIKNFKLKDVIAISLISLLYISALKNYISYTDEKIDIKEYDVSEIYQEKFLPTNALKNIEILKNRSKDVELIKGTAEIKEKNKFLTYYNFKANTLENNTIYELPYLYYPGYKIKYDGIGKEYFESENGLIAIEMDAELGTSFEIEYVGTNLMNITRVVSFVSVIIFAIYVYKKH